MMRTFARAWGRAVGRYARNVVTPRAVELILDTPLPTRPAVWLGWHEANLITIATHRFVMGRPVVAFVPDSMKGAAVHGWLDVLDVRPIPLSVGVSPGGALRAMRQALGSGADVLIAADGPDGPRHQAKPGAMLLAWKAQADVIPVACAAAPALRAPRWDRHLVPLPGADIVVVMGSPLSACDPRSGKAIVRTAAALHEVSTRARAILDARGRQRPIDRSEAGASSWN